MKNFFDLWKDGEHEECTMSQLLKLILPEVDGINWLKESAGDEFTFATTVRRLVRWVMWQSHLKMKKEEEEETFQLLEDVSHQLLELVLLKVDEVRQLKEPA